MQNRFLEFSSQIIRQHTQGGGPFDSAAMIFPEAAEQTDGETVQNSYVTNLYRIQKITEENHLYQQSFQLLNQLYEKQVFRNLYPTVEKQVEKLISRELPEAEKRLAGRMAKEIHELVREGGIEQLTVLEKRLEKTERETFRTEPRERIRKELRTELQREQTKTEKLREQVQTKETQTEKLREQLQTERVQTEKLQKQFQTERVQTEKLTEQLQMEHTIGQRSAEAQSTEAGQQRLTEAGASSAEKNEKEIRELRRELQTEKISTQEMREKEIRDREIREKEVCEKELHEIETQKKEVHEKETQETKHEKEVLEREIKEKEIREKQLVLLRKIENIYNSSYRTEIRVPGQRTRTGENVIRQRVAGAPTGIERLLQRTERMLDVSAGYLPMSLLYDTEAGEEAGETGNVTRSMWDSETGRQQDVRQKVQRSTAEPVQAEREQRQKFPWMVRAEQQENHAGTVSLPGQMGRQPEMLRSLVEAIPGEVPLVHIAGETMPEAAAEETAQPAGQHSLPDAVKKTLQNTVENVVQKTIQTTIQNSIEKTAEKTIEHRVQQRMEHPRLSETTQKEAEKVLQKAVEQKAADRNTVQKAVEQIEQTLQKPTEQRTLQNLVENKVQNVIRTTAQDAVRNTAGYQMMQSGTGREGHGAGADVPRMQIGFQPVEMLPGETSETWETMNSLNTMNVMGPKKIMEFMNSMEGKNYVQTVSSGNSMEAGKKGLPVSFYPRQGQSLSMAPGRAAGQNRLQPQLSPLVQAFRRQTGQAASEGAMETASMIYPEDREKEEQEESRRKMREHIRNVTEELQEVRRSVRTEQKVQVEKQWEIVREVLRKDSELLTEGTLPAYVGRQVQKEVERYMDESLQNMTNRVYRKLEQKLRTERERRGLV